MARVHASKTIETMLDNVSERTGIGREVQQDSGCPGLQIVIIQGDGASQVAFDPATAAPLIEATPASEVVPVPSDSE